MESAVQYILQEYQRGIHPEEIKVILMREGYAPEIIDDLFRQAFNSYGTQNVNQRIYNYIQTELQQGYDLASIKNALIQSGYQVWEIDQAINQLNSPQGGVHRHILPSKKSILAIIILTVGVLSLAFSIYFVVAQGDDRKVTPEDDFNIVLTLQPDKTSLEAGEDLNFDLTIRVEGKKIDKGLVDVNIYEQKSLRILTTDTKLAVPGRNSMSVPISDDALTGAYDVVVRFKVGSVEESKSFLIQISGVEPPADTTIITDGDPTERKIDDGKVYWDYYAPNRPPFGDDEGVYVRMGG